MIRATVFPEKNIITANPEGALSEADFEDLANTIDSYINTHDKIPSLVFQVEGFPHWASFAAMTHHLKLVKMHQRIVPKVAVVSDAAGLTALPALLDHFVKAKVRHFPVAKAMQAVQWAEKEDDDPGGFEEMDRIASNVIAVRAKGIITAQDYQEFLQPLVQKKLETHDRLNFLLLADNEFQSYDGGAIWADTRFGFSHIFSFGRIALVTDVESLRIGVKLCGPFIPAKVHVFHVEELKDAKAWIKR